MVPIGPRQTQEEGGLIYDALSIHGRSRPGLTGRLLSAGTREGRYQVWKEIDHQFDWEYVLEKVKEDCRPEVRSNDPLITRVERPECRYDIFGIAHLFPLQSVYRGPSLELVEQEEQFTRSAAKQVDLVLYEDGITHELVNVPQGNGLGDSRSYYRLGRGSEAKGIALSRELTKQDNDFWEERSSAECAHLQEKREIITIRRHLIYESKDLAGLAACKQLLRIMQQSAPMRYPEQHDVRMALRRSLIQTETAVDRARSDGSNSILLVVGGYHEPQIAAALRSPGYRGLRALYHLPAEVEGEDLPSDRPGEP